MVVVVVVVVVVGDYDVVMEMWAQTIIIVQLTLFSSKNSPALVHNNSLAFRRALAWALHSIPSLFVLTTTPQKNAPSPKSVSMTHHHDGKLDVENNG